METKNSPLYDSETGKYLREVAVKKVDRIPQDLLTDLGPLVLLERTIRQGKDDSGKPLSPQKRKAVEYSIQQRRFALAEKHTQSDLGQLFGLLGRYSVSNAYVQEEIIKRCQERGKT